MTYFKAYLQPGHPFRQDRDGMPKDIIQMFADGIDIDGTRVYARNTRSCSLRGIQSLEVYIKEDNAEARIFCAAIFPGRAPYYRPWIDIFCIRDRLNLKSFGRDYYDYYDSDLENTLLEAFCGTLGPGGKIFIEYYSDHETSHGLAIGIPPVLSRQGYKLFNLGFTWFKDWYFSEGGHEGGQKLQGEKPLDDIAKIRHLRQIKLEAQSFVEKCRVEDIKDESLRNCSTEGDDRKYILRAMDRAEETLARVDAELAESRRASFPEKAILVYPGCSR